MKKGMELSLNVIVVAAIALIVLIVIIVIFSGKIRNFSSDSGSCGAKGGMCESQCETGCEAAISAEECTSQSKVCCIDIIDEAKCIGGDNPS